MTGFTTTTANNLFDNLWSVYFEALLGVFLHIWPFILVVMVVIFFIYETIKFFNFEEIPGMLGGRFSGYKINYSVESDPELSRQYWEGYYASLDDDEDETPDIFDL